MNATMGRHRRTLELLNLLLPLLPAPAAVQPQNPEQPIPVIVTEVAPRNAIGELETKIGFYQSITLTDDPPLVVAKSEHQDIAIVRTKHYGKVLLLDEIVQLTERDADSYNEMMAHVPLMAHPNPRRVLVIGGGDGYVLSEALKHPSVERVDHVDIDTAVIEVCKEHFPWGGAWDDSRVKLHIADGAKFVRDAADGYYDVITQDSSDPYSEDNDGEPIELPSKVLYSTEHFRHIHRILSDNGVFNFQSETFNIPSNLRRISEWRSQALDVGFETARYGSILVSSYTTGQIGFMLCLKSKSTAPGVADVERRFVAIAQRGLRTSYYQPKLQWSSFDLPLWVDESIYGRSGSCLEDSNRADAGLAEVTVD